jgi:hypothetical protein
LKAEYVYVYEKKVSICTSTKNVSMCRCMNKEDQPRLAFSSIFFIEEDSLLVILEICSGLLPQVTC